MTCRLVAAPRIATWSRVRSQCWRVNRQGQCGCQEPFEPFDVPVWGSPSTPNLRNPAQPLVEEASQPPQRDLDVRAHLVYAHQSQAPTRGGPFRDFIESVSRVHKPGNDRS